MHNISKQIGGTTLLQLLHFCLRLNQVTYTRSARAQTINLSRWRIVCQDSVQSSAKRISAIAIIPSVFYSDNLFSQYGKVKAGMSLQGRQLSSHRSFFLCAHVANVVWIFNDEHCLIGWFTFILDALFKDDRPRSSRVDLSCTPE